MKIIISPAKSQDFSKIQNSVKTTEPYFLKRSEILIKELRKLDVNEISKLMSISENLATLNFNRFKKWNSNFKNIDFNAALFCFTGAVYESLSANTLKKRDISFANKNLRILSGLYGIIKPLDRIMPYRLEMGTSIKIGDNNNLYSFWRDDLSSYLQNEMLEDNDKFLINLASTEYSKAVNFKKLPVEIITPIFKENKDGKFKTVAIFAKKARGAMTRYIIENQITDPTNLKNFTWEGYQLDSINEKKGEWLFVR